MSKSDDVPRRVDYRRFATLERGIEGDIALSDLPRVVAEAWQAPGPEEMARVALGFHEDAQRRVVVGGHIAARLVLQCQRCLEAFGQQLDSRVAAVVVADDAAAADVPRADEPIMAEGDMLDVHALVADELLLALPGVARCSRPACRARYDNASDARRGDAQQQRKDNPFAVLKELEHGDDQT